MRILLQFLAFFRRRDSESAFLVCMDMAEFMTTKDRQEAAMYFRCLAELKGKPKEKP